MSLRFDSGWLVIYFSICSCTFICSALQLRARDYTTFDPSPPCNGGRPSSHHALAPPHWSLIHFGMAFVYWCGRRYDQAIEECHEALELDSNSPQAHVWLGLSYVAKLAWEPAIAALHKAVELSRRPPVAVACLGEAYAAAGFADEARNVLRELTG